MEKERAIHFIILAWEVAWTEEPGGIQSMGLWRIRYNWAAKNIEDVIEDTDEETDEEL